MPAAADLWLFVAASLLLILAPGPDLLYLLALSVSRGRAAGVATALGLAAGNLAHTAAAAAGVSVIFRSSPTAFQVLKFTGAAYLLWLAWRAWAERHRAPGPAAPGTARGGLFWRGVLMNLLNPKVALFFLAFLPQFVAPAADGVAVQMIALGLLFTGLVVVVFGAVGLFAGALGGWLRRSPWVQRLTGPVVSLVLLALALRLALV